METQLGLTMINNELLASSSGDSTIRIWNLTTNSLKYNMSGHTSAIRVLKILSSDVIASGSDDYTIKIWNFTNGTLVGTLYGHTNLIVCSLDLLGSD